MARAVHHVGEQAAPRGAHDDDAPLGQRLVAAAEHAEGPLDAHGLARPAQRRRDVGPLEPRRHLPRLDQVGARGGDGAGKGLVALREQLGDALGELGGAPLERLEALDVALAQRPLGPRYRKRQEGRGAELAQLARPHHAGRGVGRGGEHAPQVARVVRVVRDERVDVLARRAAAALEQRAERPLARDDLPHGTHQDGPALLEGVVVDTGLRAVLRIQGVRPLAQVPLGHRKRHLGVARQAAHISHTHRFTHSNPLGRSALFSCEL